MSHDLRGLNVAHYRLIEPIGESGIWRAREDRLERDVAIKIVFPAQTEDEARRELRLMIEAKAAARIHSRHVARVLMLGHTDDGALFVATELLKGETLETVLKREGKLSLDRGLRIARHIARGLLAAHGAGVLHRGLEPSRIMLVDDDGETEIAKIIDFGVAKRLESADAELTRRGELLAGEEYSAPEMKTGEDVDGRVDIYALGMIVKKMLGDDVPHDVAKLIHKCIAPDRNDRYARIIEVLDALAWILSRPLPLASESTQPYTLPLVPESMRAGLAGDRGDDEQDPGPATEPFIKPPSLMPPALPIETSEASENAVPPPVEDVPTEREVLAPPVDPPTIREVITPIQFREIRLQPPRGAESTATILRSSVTHPRVIAAICATIALCVAATVFVIVANNAVAASSAQHASMEQKAPPEQPLVVDVQTVRIQPDPVVVDMSLQRLAAPPEPEPEVIDELIVTPRHNSPPAEPTPKKKKKSFSRPKTTPASEPIAIQQPKATEEDDADFIRVRSEETP
jgi:serine/threonine protein kinase